MRKWLQNEPWKIPKNEIFHILGTIWFSRDSATNDSSFNFGRSVLVKDETWGRPTDYDRSTSCAVAVLGIPQY